MNIHSDKTIYYFNSRKLQYLLSVPVFILLLGFGLFRATKGFDISETGYYITSAMRYALGDVPFRDEIINVIHPYDLIFSFVFMICPDISLLQLRYLYIGVHLGSSLMLFIILSRYASPLLVALSCGVMFLMNNFSGIMVFNYNSLSSDLSVISMVCWLFAITSSRKAPSFLFSLLGGFFFSMTVISYPPLGVLICIPVMTMIIAFISSEKERRHIQSSVTFITTFGVVMLSAGIILAVSGLIPDFLQAFSDIRSATFGNAQTFNLTKIHSIWKDFFYIAPIGFSILGILLLPLSLIILPWKNNYYFSWAIAFMASVLILFVLPDLLTKEIAIYPEELSYHAGYVNVISSAFTLILSVLLLFFNNRHFVIPEVKDWRTIVNAIIAWGGLSVLIYCGFSGNYFRASPHGVMPLFVIGMVGIYRIADHYATQRKIEDIRSIMWRALFFLIIAVFFIIGLNFNYRSIYRDSEADKLTAGFTHLKLKGIYSTPAKVEVIEELLDYLKDRVMPGDYFLAYNDLAMLYFITHTRPAYAISNATEWWASYSVRKRLVRRIIENNRIPEYAVRMLAVPDSEWDAKPDYRDSPLDSFVKSRYYLEKIIYPFEVWHLGDKLKLQVSDVGVPVFRQDFTDWQGRDTINIKDLSKVAAPLQVLERSSGSFSASLSPAEKGSNVLRIYPVAGKKGILYDNLRLSRQNREEEDISSEALTNRSFEQGLEGWSGPSDSSTHLPGEPEFLIDFSDDATDGGSSLFLGSENHIAGISTIIHHLVSGQRYLLSLDAKNTTGSSVPEPYLSPVSNYEIKIQDVNLLNGWKRYLISFVPDDKSVKLAIYSDPADKYSEWRINLGYSFQESNQDIELSPGQEIVIEVVARISSKSLKTAYLFVKDKAEMETDIIGIHKSSWERYIISKRIKDTISNIKAGINWEPDSTEEWLEIKNIRILVK